MDAHGYFPGIVDLANVAKKGQKGEGPLEGKELTIHFVQNLVDVGDDQVKPDGLAIHFGEHDEVWPDDILELLDLIREFLVGHGHEAPALFPNRVVQLLEDLGLLDKLLPVEGPQGD